MQQIAILDDYQNVALELADWSPVTERATVTVFNDHLSDAKDIVDRLRRFEVVCVMRERTPLTRDILSCLPELKLIVSTGPRNASIDVEAAAEFGIEVMHTNYESSPTIELTWALILASARNLTIETDSLRSGGWQRSVGDGVRGKVLAVLGLGNIGREVARIAGAFGMEVMAWSENLSPEKAAAAGARLVSKRELFERADILTMHLVLSSRTRGLVGRPELALMKRSARLVNTSRGPIVDENALVEALRDGCLGALPSMFLTSNRCRPSTRSGGSTTWSRRRTSDTCHVTCIACSIRTRSRTLPVGWEGDLDA